MLNLIASFFRTAVIINIYRHLSLQKTLRFKHRLFNYLFLIVLFLVSTSVNIFFQHLLPVISIPLFALYGYISYRNKPDLTFVITAISYAIYCVSFNTISFILTLIVFIPSYCFGIEVPYFLVLITNSILTYFATNVLFKIKKLKSGIALLTGKSFINFGMAISLLILALKTIDCFYINSYQYIDILPFATILLALLLFTWWRKQITKSYIEKLRKLEVQSLYDELEEKERLIKKLTADNQSLSRIIHKDNKLIPAMEHAVTDFLSGSQDGNPESLRQYGLELTEKLREMAQDRQGILDSYEGESHKLKLTGHVSLDAMLVYMQKKALTNHITFECKHSPETIDYLLSKISEEDLTHILSDLTENALIAMNKQQNGRLQITFGKLEKEAYISIADTGIPFDLATLHSFGLQPHTTHEDSGGSGIGLMDIWNIKRKYRATIQIQEYAPENASFTKRIFFSFNAKNHYVIQSFRHAEISNTQTRGDLYVIPSDTKESNEDKQHERINQNPNS